MGSQLDPLPLSKVGSRERASKFQLPQLDFVKPSSWFHFVTWECVIVACWSGETGAAIARVRLAFEFSETLPRATPSFPNPISYKKKFIESRNLKIKALNEYSSLPSRSTQELIKKRCIVFRKEWVSLIRAPKAESPTHGRKDAENTIWGKVVTSPESGPW
jgi:hypothetical protein